MSEHNAENDAARLVVRCDDTDGLLAAGDSDQPYAVEHVCGADALRHVAAMARAEEAVALAEWEEAVANGEGWALADECPIPPEVTHDGGDNV